jgi:oligopeptide transport system substrate-binding protein
MSLWKKRLIRAAFCVGLMAGMGQFVDSAMAETTLTRGIGSSVGTLDPQLNFLANEGWIQDDMYEGLTAQDASGNIIPGAADKWEMSDDGLTYTFHLRDGLKWSNGDRMCHLGILKGLVRSSVQEKQSLKA